MKKVLITGGNKGIGLETTKCFLNDNYEVHIVARDFSNFALISEVKTYTYDLSSLQQVRKFISELDDVDVLINNAGMMNALPFDKYSEKKRDQLIQLNIKTPIELISHFSNNMISRKCGRIVNVASIAGQVGHPDIWYGVTKAGMINVTKSFAKILGSKGIVVNAVAPGPVETDMLLTIPEERKVAIKTSVYSGRFAKPEEVAQTIFWLGNSSPEYINGICIDLNNGAFPR